MEHIRDFGKKHKMATIHVPFFFPINDFGSKNVLETEVYINDPCLNNFEKWNVNNDENERYKNFDYVLYNIETDISESIDISKDNQDIVERLHNKLVKQTKDSPPQAIGLSLYFGKLMFLEVVIVIIILLCSFLITLKLLSIIYRLIIKNNATKSKNKVI
jgi:hypothetical protein